MNTTISTYDEQQALADGRISSGVAGLDNILGGGLPSNHLYLMEGDPGTGKTTLALQFLLAGVAAGERCLYVTLSESKRELLWVAKSHGWSLDGIRIYEMSPQDEDVSADAQYTVFHPSEVELADTTAAMLKQVEEVQPSRVVLDSLSELRMLARDPLRYRRQILGLKRHFAGRNCTVLLLDDRTAATNDVELQSIVHGVVIMQALERDFGVKRRRLEVRKLRGSAYREGYHDYTIVTGGVAVFPRLIASEHHNGLQRRKIASGLSGMDELMGGGLDNGTSTLLMGPAGSGKSTVAIRYALSAAERAEKAVLFNFDETVETLLMRTSGLGMSLEKHLDSGMIRMVPVDPAELSPGEFVEQVRVAVTRDAVQMIVIDSLNGFMSAMPGESFLTMQMHELLSFLNRRGVTTLMTLAQHGVIGTAMDSPVDLSYLADTVILFRYFETEGSVRQAISVLKKRSGRHERTIRQLVFEPGRLSIGEPLVDFEGVLTGVPRFRGEGRKLREARKRKDG
jgi:circadian clock protein KaiC